jgi:hypothetical protein
MPALRSTRATVFAAVCVTLAAIGHVAAHGTVSPWAMGAGFAGVLVVAWALTGAERSLATIMGGLLGGQFMLHSLFMSATPPAGGPMTMQQPMSVAGAGTGHSSMTMTFAHVVAAVVAAWWLRKGERAVWALARRAATVASRPLRVLLALLDAAPVEAPAAPVPLRTSRARLRPGRSPLRHSVIRRGPPFRSTVPAQG